MTARVCFLVLLALTLLGIAPRSYAGDPVNGRQIWLDNCTGCHGFTPDARRRAVGSTIDGLQGAFNTYSAMAGFRNAFTFQQLDDLSSYLAGPPDDVTPNAFTFTAVTDVKRSSTQTSGSVAITGINQATPVAIFNGTYSVGCNGTFTALAGSISNGQTICVRHTASSGFASATTTTLNIGGVNGTFTTTTVPDITLTSEFVKLQYRDFLLRDPTATELTAGTNAINGGQTRAAFVESIIRSVEYQDLGGPVTRLYTAYFLRVPDPDGLSFWKDAYKKQNPWTFVGISNFFVISNEFKQRYGTLTNPQFVDLIYQNILGRAPDPSGRAFWVDELNSGRRNAGQVMADFSESPENKTVNRPLVEVAGAYHGLLRQAADAAKLSEYTPIIRAGGSIQPLITQLLASPAYAARFAP